MKVAANLLIMLSLKLWATDLSFAQYPFGPPNRGLRNSFAWWAYHTGIELERRAALDAKERKE